MKSTIGSRILVVAVTVASLMSIMPAAHASHLLSISGIVTTPAGVPIQGAGVSDGGQSSITGADGRPPGEYHLQELGFGTYELTASKQGMTSDVATVELTTLQPSANQDFTLLYESLLQVPDPYISTAAGEATLTATLRTWAAYPGSCAQVFDARTSFTEPMTHVGIESGQEVWNTHRRSPKTPPKESSA